MTTRTGPRRRGTSAGASPIMSPPRLLLEQAERILPARGKGIQEHVGVIAFAVLIEHRAIQRHMHVRDAMLGAEILDRDDGAAFCLERTRNRQFHTARSEDRRAPRPAVVGVL